MGMKHKFDTLPTCRHDRVVTWSGGYDSTLVLLKELLLYGHAECWTFNFCGYSKSKFTMEEKARSNFKKYAKQIGWKINHETIKIGSSFVPSGFMPQQYMWINLLLAYGREETVFLLGFHKSDDFFKYKHNYERIIKHTNVCTGKKVGINLPLEYMEKWEIIKEIRENNIEKYVWTCEDVEKNESCGNCVPCRSLRMCNDEIKYQEKLK